MSTLSKKQKQKRNKKKTQNMSAFLKAVFFFCPLSHSSNISSLSTVISHKPIFAKKMKRHKQVPFFFCSLLGLFIFICVFFFFAFLFYFAKGETPKKGVCLVSRQHQKKNCFFFFFFFFSPPHSLSLTFPIFIFIFIFIFEYFSLSLYHNVTCNKGVCVCLRVHNTVWVAIVNRGRVRLGAKIIARLFFGSNKPLFPFLFQNPNPRFSLKKVMIYEGLRCHLVKRSSWYTTAPAPCFSTFFPKCANGFFFFFVSFCGLPLILFHFFFLFFFFEILSHKKALYFQNLYFFFFPAQKKKEERRFFA